VTNLSLLKRDNQLKPTKNDLIQHFRDPNFPGLCENLISKIEKNPKSVKLSTFSIFSQSPENDKFASRE
jgi:hypothetical protein